jgi:hypothetical protein
MLHKVTKLTADGAGTASGEVSGIQAARYAGCYYQLNPAGSCNIEISNLGRVVFTKTGATNSDGVQEIAPNAEKLVDDDVLVGISGATPGTVITLSTYFSLDN